MFSYLKTVNKCFSSTSIFIDNHIAYSLNLLSQERFQDMLDNELQYALFYITVILIVYLFGLILLLLHYIWTKNGQISLFDIYLELLHMLPFKQENRTNLNAEIEGTTSYRDLRPIPMRLSNFHRGSRGKSQNVSISNYIRIFYTLQ